MTGSDLDHEMVVIVVCILMVGTLLGLPVGIAVGRTKVEKDAIKSGHAEYYLDENNDRKFRWREIK